MKLSKQKVNKVLAIVIISCLSVMSILAVIGTAKAVLPPNNNRVFDERLKSLETQMETVVTRQAGTDLPENKE